YSDANDFKKAVLNSTNTYRAQHNASALTWNNSLATFAAKWGGACVFEHSGGPSGENLASGYPNATASIEAWGNERAHYDFGKAQFSEQTGHFTQLVWKASTTVGCSRTDCSGKTGAKAAPGWFVVCEYYPPGNVIGAFKQNVQKQVK
ncbi:PR-1-like protein, partial [Mytilinidion resinicola]